MKSYIPRPLYTKRIEPFVDKDIIKVITGQRKLYSLANGGYNKGKQSEGKYNFC